LCDTTNTQTAHLTEKHVHTLRRFLHEQRMSVYHKQTDSNKNKNLAGATYYFVPDPKRKESGYITIIAKQ